MKSIIILYMPGHAGNFLTRLFSLSPETMPHLTVEDLENSLNCKKLKPINRIEYYSFDRAITHYLKWQDFHRAFTDFSHSPDIELLNNTLDNKFDKAVYSIHPVELLREEFLFLQTQADCYHVSLDDNIFSNWVENSRSDLNFVTRKGEEIEFSKLVNENFSKAIDLTKILTSESEFLEEYLRVCALMKLTPMTEMALELYRNWRSIRVDADSKQSELDLNIRSRPPNDEFSFSLLKSLLESIEHDYEAYHIWTNPPGTFQNFLEKLLKPWKPNIVIGIKDLLDMWKDFNWWQDTIQLGPSLIVDLANKYPNKNFIIFTSLENLDQEVGSIDNVQFIPWGGDFTNQQWAYAGMEPVLNKNFNSNKNFISLNRHARDHRMVLLSYLFGLGYDQWGDISFLHQVGWSTKDLLEVLPWEFSMDRHADDREIILSGYSKVHRNEDLVKDDYLIYTGGVNNNYVNFENKLRSRYENSFVEIITESSFTPPSYMITEKFLHSIYGCNFPILLSGAGAVAHLREVGFDMFDDIVDHSYDSMPDPFDRIINAVKLNSRLLTDGDHIKSLWKDNRSRFERNVEFAKKDMYDWYRNRATEKFKEIRWK